MGKVVEPVVNVNEVSRVSSGTIIRGDIYSPNDIRIDGSFEGRIISKSARMPISGERCMEISM